MGYRIKPDGRPLRCLIDQRWEGRPSGPMRIHELANRLDISAAHLANVIGGSKDCSYPLASRLAEELSYPGRWLRVEDIFIENERESLEKSCP